MLLSRQHTPHKTTTKPTGDIIKQWNLHSERMESTRACYAGAVKLWDSDMPDTRKFHKQVTWIFSSET
jgi:hypothetical protein